MNTHRAKFKFRGAEALWGLWGRCVQISHALLRQWVPGVRRRWPLAVSGHRISLWHSRRSPRLRPLPFLLLFLRPFLRPLLLRPHRAGSTIRCAPVTPCTALPGDLALLSRPSSRPTASSTPTRFSPGRCSGYPPAAEGCPVRGSSTYIVQRGDTLYSIARRFGTTYRALAALNGLRYPYTIYVGQRLTISGSGAPTPPSQRIHIVQRGDTLWSIALRYGTTPWAIAAANGLRNLNLIYVGQRLVIP